MSNSTRTDAELKARVDELMQRPYRMEIRWDEDYWAVEFPQLPGLVAGAEDWSSLAATVDDAKRAYFEAALEHGDELPEPEDTPSSDVSGKVLLRLPKSLHRQAIREATRDGVSINTWLLTASSSRKESAARSTDRSIPRLSSPSWQSSTDQISANNAG
jgi:antitoxin HicB